VEAQLLFSVAGEGLRDWTLVTTPPLHLHLNHQFLLDMFLYLFHIN
jgi:hypothetical protein